MARPQRRGLDFLSVSRITNLPAAVAAGQPVTYEQWLAQSEGLAWKDNVRAGAGTNVNLAAPGTSVGGVTMAPGDRFIARGQTVQTQNGIYIWNGAAVPATRSDDASTFDELENAVVFVDEGTDAGTAWRQTQVNGVIGTDNVIWASFASDTPAASETTAGKAELATQAETDAGTDDLRIVTPLKLANWSGRVKKFAATIGDGSATSIAVTHNIGTRNVIPRAFLHSAPYTEVDCEVQHTDGNTCTFLFDAAPTSNEIDVVIVG